jgi:hypothetical protein
VTRLRGHGVELACLAAGGLLLAVTVWQVGLGTLAGDLRRIGWGLVVILVVESANVGFNTWGWGLSFPPGERGVSARRLVAARLAGDGVNYLTPSATVGGELLRVRLLGSRMPLGLRWASVSVAKLAQTVAQAIFIFLGLAITLPRLTPLAPWAAWLGGGVATLTVSIGLGWLLRQGLWGTVERTAGRVGLGRRLPMAWGTPGRDLDAALGRLGGWRLSGSLACFVLGWAVGAAEIYLILRWLGVPADWQTAVAVETGSVLVDGILFFVPGKVGTQEGGKVALFLALGLSPARGLTVGVVRRVRELFYAGLGLIALGLLTVRRDPRAHPFLTGSSELR